MLFDKSRLQNAVKAYKSDFKGNHWQEEKYKWVAVKCFQDNWDVDAPDFAATVMSRRHHFDHDYFVTFQVPGVALKKVVPLPSGTVSSEVLPSGEISFHFPDARPAMQTWTLSCAFGISKEIGLSSSLFPLGRKSKWEAMSRAKPLSVFQCV